MTDQLPPAMIWHVAPPDGRDTNHYLVVDGEEGIVAYTDQREDGSDAYLLAAAPALLRAAAWAQSALLDILGDDERGAPLDRDAVREAIGELEAAIQAAAAPT